MDVQSTTGLPLAAGPRSREVHTGPSPNSCLQQLPMPFRICKKVYRCSCTVPNHRESLGVAFLRAVHSNPGSNLQMPGRGHDLVPPSPPLQRRSSQLHMLSPSTIHQGGRCRCWCHKHAAPLKGGMLAVSQIVLLHRALCLVGISRPPLMCLKPTKAMPSWGSPDRAQQLAPWRSSGLTAACTHSELHLPAAATQAHECSLSTSLQQPRTQSSTSLQQPHKRTNTLSPPPCSSHTSARMLSLHLPAAATQAHEYSLSTSLQQPRT